MSNVGHFLHFVNLDSYQNNLGERLGFFIIHYSAKHSKMQTISTEDKAESTEGHV